MTNKHNHSSKVLRTFQVMKFLPKESTKSGTFRLQGEQNSGRSRQIQTSQASEIGTAVDLMLGINIAVADGWVRRRCCGCAVAITLGAI
jgi:hypothetical protein